MGVGLLCKYVHEESLPLMITIIGAMGTGKTTLAHRIRECCFPGYELVQLEDVDFSGIQKGSKLYLLFDDFSYKLTGRSNKDREKLNTIFRVRHILGTNSVVLVFVVHYLRSLAVFLRSAQVRILTSISEPEIRMYHQDYLFTLSALWDYLHYYSKYKDRYIVLYHGLRSGEHIVDVTEEPEEGRKSKKQV